MKLIDKGWKKGAIVGGIIGILPIVLLLFSSRPCEPGMTGCNQGIIYLNLILLSIGNYLSRLLYNLGILHGNWGTATYIPILFLNVLGWILIGAILGFLYDKFKIGELFED